MDFEDFENFAAVASLTAMALLVATCLALLLGLTLGIITIEPCDEGKGCEYAPMVWPIPGGGFSVG